MKYLRTVEQLEHLNIFFGVVLNLFLLYLILKFSKKSLGTYKNLLTIFACYDIFLCVVHAVINHQIILIDTKFIADARSFVESRFLTAFYCGAFTVPFPLTTINFIYRLWAVKHPEWIYLFSKRWFIALLGTVCFYGAFAWFCVVYFLLTGEEEDDAKAEARRAYFDRYNETVMEGYAIMDHWRNGTLAIRPALALLYFDTVIIGAILIVIGLGALTFNAINSAKRLSGYSKTLQSMLLKTLCIQTAVPIFCVYIPFFVILSVSFVGFDDNGVAAAMAVLNLCFPAVDAIVIIFLMADYRKGLISMIVPALRGNTVDVIGNTTHFAPNGSSSVAKKSFSLTNDF